MSTADDFEDGVVRVQNLQRYGTNMRVHGGNVPEKLGNGDRGDIYVR